MEARYKVPRTERRRTDRRGPKKTCGASAILRPLRAVGITMSPSRTAWSVEIHVGASRLRKGGRVACATTSRPQLEACSANVAAAVVAPLHCADDQQEFAVDLRGLVMTATRGPSPGSKQPRG